VPLRASFGSLLVTWAVQFTMPIARATRQGSAHWSERSPVSGEFETCPSWGPSVDRCWPSTPIILKTLSVARFDHSANWPAKVRNVSKVGSQFPKWPFLALLSPPSSPAVTYAAGAGCGAAVHRLFETARCLGPSAIVAVYAKLSARFGGSGLWPDPAADTIAT